MKHKLYSVMVFKASMSTKIVFLRKHDNHYESESREFSYKNWRMIERLVKDYPMRINPHDDTLSIVWTIRPID
jgi:hypothetical protein